MQSSRLSLSDKMFQPTQENTSLAVLLLLFCGRKNIQNKKKSCKSLSQTDDNCRKANSQRIEKILPRIVVLQLSLCIRIKGGDGTGVT